eukprot:CAMPEP_0180007518 /NCGR_PEP_ID=MMETSP0984-20121128/13966_1 /TAXON_ID=483367 /ORGANISM="non described non described, Strain CCMP 2436" /LENGTH=117 /DNA_ID=CAMNT_0021928691 /DNA_START=200 /DNA_END=553 /DNA_ORIENTATION=-
MAPVLRRLRRGKHLKRSPTVERVQDPTLCVAAINRSARARVSTDKHVHLWRRSPTPDAEEGRHALAHYPPVRAHPPLHDRIATAAHVFHCGLVPRQDSGRHHLHEEWTEAREQEAPH